MKITTTYDEAMVKAMIAEAVAKERNSWPAEMEAMERQVNILTDALAKSNADAERYRKLVSMETDLVEPITIWHYLRNPDELDAAIRARNNT